LDDVYRINVAKTEFRDGYNLGDIDRVLSVFHDEFVDMSGGLSSGFGSSANSSLRARLTELFANYSVKFVPIIIDIVPAGDLMFEFGWHEFTLTPKAGGECVRRRHRYFELWKKDSSGNWKIKYFMDNPDLAEILLGQTAKWFISEAGT
jgi:ketosteroid isomerase-like protein